MSAATRIEIDAPDSASASRLQRRLAHAQARTNGRGRRWQVMLSDADPVDVEGVVREWLGDVGVVRTTMWVDGWPCPVREHVDDRRR